MMYTRAWALRCARIAAACSLASCVGADAADTDQTAASAVGAASSPEAGCVGVGVDAGDDGLSRGVDAGIDASATSAADASATPAADDASIAPLAPSDVMISNLRSGGSACPASATVLAISEVAGTFEARFERFALTTGPDDPLGTLDCTLNLQVDVPAGKTVALQSLTLRGDAQLPAGADARFTASYSFAGAGATARAPTLPLVGPFDGAFAGQAQFASGDLLFRGCQEAGRRLNVRVGLSLTGSDAAHASARLTQVDGVRFAVRECP